MSDALNPLDDAKQDLRKWSRRLRYLLTDFVKAHTTIGFLQVLGVTALGGIVVVLRLPWVAWVAFAAVVVLLVVYSYYATKRIKRQEGELLWAFVHGKRAQQSKLDQQIAVDSAILTLIDGERHTPQGFRAVSPDLRAALSAVNHRLRQAEARADAAEAVRDGKATDAQRRVLARHRQNAQPTPRKIDAGTIKLRREARKAERDQLEAEIQSLATADSIQQAMEAEEVAGARRTRREREEAASKASKAARDRVRAGRKATTEEPAQSISLEVRPNGIGPGPKVPPQPTPEQIARGETPTDDT